MESTVTTDAMAHLTTGAVVVYAIEALKRAGWFRWMHADSGTINRIVSGVAAAGMALGIQATGDASIGWVIHVPSATVLLLGVWEWAKQFVLQQLIFDGIVQKSGSSAAKVPAPPPVGMY